MKVLWLTHKLTLQTRLEVNAVQLRGFSFKTQKVENWNYFLKIQHTISRTTDHWTNTRLVSTHLNAFLLLKSSMVMKIWIFENFGLSSALDIRVDRVNIDKYLTSIFTITFRILHHFSFSTDNKIESWE